MIDITKETAGAFWVALHKAQPGDRILYARGKCCNGAHRQEAMQAYEAGLALLMQQRNGPSDFSYIAQKIVPRKLR